MKIDELSPENILLFFNDKNMKNVQYNSETKKTVFIIMLSNGLP